MVVLPNAVSGYREGAMNRTRLSARYCPQRVMTYEVLRLCPCSDGARGVLCIGGWWIMAAWCVRSMDGLGVLDNCQCSSALNSYR